MSPMFFIYFLILLFISIPVFFSLLIAPIGTIFLDGNLVYIKMIVNRFFSGMNSSALLALPFFMLAGDIMGKGGITHRIINFAQSMVGHRVGGLGHVVIIASTLFAALTGSAVAATSAIGTMLIPEMEKNGYKTSYAGAVTAAATVLGPIIPPSGIMIIYAFVMNISVGAMFIAGIIPGLMFCISLMIVNRIVCAKRGYTHTLPKATAKERKTSFYKASLPLLTPIIILGGIYGGIATPTESAAVAVFYSLLLAVFILKTLTIKDVFEIMKSSANSSASVLLLVAAAVAFASLVSLSGISSNISKFILHLTSNLYLLFFIINIFLFIVGMFLDVGPAILILATILAPPMIQLGVHPLHFAIVMCINLTIGLATPPMGLVLFVASSVSKIPMQTLTKEILPFLLAEVIIIFILTYIPQTVLFLPQVLGLVN